MLRAARALSDDGVVLLEVPCAIAPHLMLPGWFTFEHLHYFSQAALLRLLHAAGLAPLELRVALEAYIYPVIAVIARKAERPPLHDDRVAVREAMKFLAELIAHDDVLWKASAARLQHLTGPGTIWGAGVHTTQLLDRTPLHRAEIKAIVDRDSQKWGLKQAGRKIIGPERFFAEGGDGPVVISSFAAEAEIARTLSDAGVSRDRIVRLYG